MFPQIMDDVYTLKVLLNTMNLIYSNMTSNEIGIYVAALQYKSSDFNNVDNNKLLMDINHERFELTAKNNFLNDIMFYKLRVPENGKINKK